MEIIIFLEARETEREQIGACKICVSSKYAGSFGARKGSNDDLTISAPIQTKESS